MKQDKTKFTEVYSQTEDAREIPNDALLFFSKWCVVTDKFRVQTRTRKSTAHQITTHRGVVTIGQTGQAASWIWECMWTKGTPTFVPNTVRLLIWLHFGALTRETGHVSYRPLSNMPCSVFQYLLNTGMLKLVLNILYSGLWWSYSRVCCLYSLTQLCPHWLKKDSTYNSLSDTT